MASKSACAPCSPCPCLPKPTSMANAMSDATNEPPMAESAMRRTPSFPRRLPKTPFTKAPRAGSPRMMATSVKFCAGKMLERSSIARRSVLEQVGLVAANRATEAVDGEPDRQTHRGFGGCHGDDEEGEHLSVLVVGPHAVEGHQGEVHGVEQELDAHQL